MTSGEPIRSVAVAGDGIVAWSAAAALMRRLPWLAVSLARAAVPPAALADRIASTLPSVGGFHADLGLADDDAVLRAGACRRLGTLFAGWVDGLPDFFHGYGAHGQPFGPASFQQHWVRRALGGGAHDFDAHAPAAALASAGRYAPPGTIAGDYESGLILDPPRYRAMMRAFALHLGVREAGELVATERREDGGVARLRLADGGALDADLFVDATGPAATLRAPLGGERDDWSAQLLCDRVAIAPAPANADLPPNDRVEALPSGWRWSASAPEQGQVGACYASWWTEDGARAIVDAESAVLRPGQWREPWRGNCVAVGDAAVAIEPLEWTNLHLAHSAIDRIVAMLPGRDCAELELTEYNRQCAAEATRVRDFVLLHYLTARRPEPFWQAAAAVEPPASLAHTLTQFRERGRLPIYEEETFTRESWAAVLFGHGVLPRRVDPLIEDTDPAESARAMAAYRRALAEAVAQAPAHRTFHEQQMRRIGR